MNITTLNKILNRSYDYVDRDKFIAESQSYLPDEYKTKDESLAVLFPVEETLGAIFDFGEDESFDFVYRFARMNLTELAERFDIPYRTMQNWKEGKAEISDYLLRFIFADLLAPEDVYTSHGEEYEVSYNLRLVDLSRIHMRVSDEYDSEYDIHVIDSTRLSALTRRCLEDQKVRFRRYGSNTDVFVAHPAEEYLEDRAANRFIGGYISLMSDADSLSLWCKDESWSDCATLAEALWTMPPSQDIDNQCDKIGLILSDDIRHEIIDEYTEYIDHACGYTWEEGYGEEDE